MNGRYKNNRNLLTGFLYSGSILPLIKYPIITGTNVIDSKAAPAIAYVFVNASGLKSLPDCPVSVNTGMNETVIIKRE